MQKDSVPAICQVVEDILKKAGFSDFSLHLTEHVSDASQNPILNIETRDESRFLIGQHGDNLRAIQYLSRLIARKLFSDQKTNFILDVNGYRDQKGKMIVEMARDAAREASKDKKSVFLRPMSAYERRIVHMTLSKDQGVVTESVGEGEERKVVVRPVSYIDEKN